MNDAYGLGPSFCEEARSRGFLIKRHPDLVILLAVAA
jgi:hypothetical protein